MTQSVYIVRCSSDYPIIKSNLDMILFSRFLGDLGFKPEWREWHGVLLLQPPSLIYLAKETAYFLPKYGTEINSLALIRARSPRRS